MLTTFLTLAAGARYDPGPVVQLVSCGAKSRNISLTSSRSPDLSSSHDFVALQERMYLVTQKRESNNLVRSTLAQSTKNFNAALHVDAVLTAS